MRVLYFTDRYTVHDRRFLQKLATEHEIYFLTLQGQNAAYEDRSLPDGVHSVFWDKAVKDVPGCTIEQWMHYLPLLEVVLEKVKPDLVHVGPVQSCGFLVALTGFHPVLLTSWGSDILVDTDRNELWRWITRYTLLHADAFFCDCQAVRARTQQLVPFPDDKIVQFPWGIDLDTFHPGNDTAGVRASLGWEEQVVVLSMRTWEPIYGLEVVLEAFKIAYAQNPKLRLLLLGDGSLAPLVKSYIHEHALEEVVHTPGRIAHDDLPAYFTAADLYFTCSFSDGSSISLLEAMATGLPVVVTDAPGNQEWVIPGENGWLASPADAAAFAKALQHAVALPASEQARLRDNNMQVARTRADWSRNIEKLLEAYASLEQSGAKVS